MHKPFIVGIGGGTCSGKSTLADLMQEAFSDIAPVVIHMDAYYIRPFINTIAPITGKTYCEMNHPDALDLERLYADFHAAIRNADNRLVIIEGLFALYLPEIYEQLDLKVFVDLKSDERLVRRIRRHMSRGETFEAITDRLSTRFASATMNSWSRPAGVPTLCSTEPLREKKRIF